MIRSHATADGTARHWPASCRSWGAAALLALGVAFVYWPVRHYGFIAYDDPDYVTQNRLVQAGLTWDGVAWAFGSAHASNWHPLTWLSHMLDVELFGRCARGPHLVNVGLHVANTLLVFVLLRRLTGVFWSSVVVAALFGLHPLRVESVAWVAERKDVLSACFFLLALVAYARFAATPAEPVTKRPRRWSYVGAWVLFSCGLMSKPMVVTLPFVMLLLDFWPLRRLAWSGSAFDISPRQAVVEKLPFFAMSAIAGVVTYVVQQQGGAVRSLDAFSFGSRLENAVVSYGRYIAKTFWPTDLAVFYPHPGAWPTIIVLLAVVLLVGLTAAACRLARRFPFAFVGWAWFCGMLVPTLGLIQVGGQSMADRYTYLPSIGLFIVLVWTANEGWTRWRFPRAASGILVVTVIAACAVRTQGQLHHWRDTESVFRHAVAVTENNFVAHNNLAGVLLDRGDLEGAIEHARAAVTIRPDYADAYNNLGQALLQKGDGDAAVEQLLHAVRLAPDASDLRNNLGNAWLQKGEWERAIVCYRQALTRAPDDAKAHNNLGWALFRAGRSDEAMAHLQRAITLEPNYANAHHNLAGVLAQRARPADAIAHLQHAASAYAMSGDFAEAMAATEKGLRLAESHSDRQLGETLRLQFESYRAQVGASP